MKKVIVLLGILLVLNIVFSLKLYSDNRELYCDLVKSVYAEREYTYPLLRTIGEPNEMAKDILNPITTKEKYNQSYCNK